MLYATASTDALAKDPVFSGWAARAPADATVWGLATGPAVAEWVRVVMPVPAEGQASLAPVVERVTSLTYEVRAGQKVMLSSDLTCTSRENATLLRQTLEAVRLLQQMAWRTMHQDAPNPYEQLTFRTQDTHLLFNATMDYAALGTAIENGFRLYVQEQGGKLGGREIGLRQLIMDVATRVELAYYDLIFARENVKVQEKALELARRLLEENKKRVEVARVLATQPRLVLLDEVMAGLNPAVKAPAKARKAMKIPAEGASR